MTAIAEAPAENGSHPARAGDIHKTTALAVRSDPLHAKIQYARALAESGLLPAAFRRNPGNVLFAVEYGDMLGLPPMAAITGIHVIEGKPSASAGLISALVRRAGHKLRVTGDARSATCQIVRCDDPDYTFGVTFTIEDAKTAGLTGKDVWKKYGASMLKARAITQCARDACEEALFGLHYTPEELGAEVDEDGRVVSAQLVSDETSGADPGDPWYVRPAAQGTPPSGERAAKDALAERAAGLETADACGDLWRETAAEHRSGHITDAERTQVEALIAARRKELLSAGEPEVVDAEIVEGTVVPVLDPEDPWSAKVETVTCEDDAEDAKADVLQQVKSGRIPQERADVIIAAIYAKAASLGSQVAP